MDGICRVAVNLDAEVTFSDLTLAVPMDDDLEISPSSVTVLEGHSSEVFICAWSPTESMLASGCVQLCTTFPAHSHPWDGFVSDQLLTYIPGRCMQVWGLHRAHLDSASRAIWACCAGRAAVARCAQALGKERAGAG